MNTFATIEVAVECNLITYYTLHVENRELSEFDDFQLFFLDEDDVYGEEYGQLLAFIEEIGLRGAKPGYFRPENEAKAIPVEFVIKHGEVIVEKGNPIRLYCIPLGRNAVILLNGGIKTNDDPSKCSNVSQYFDEAKRFGRAVDAALRNGSLRLNHDRLDLEYGCELSVRL